MTRPGYVLTVDEDTPPLVVFRGGSVRLERLPVGSDVVYPADAEPAVRSLSAELDRVLAAPEGSEPLERLLTAGTVLTIVVDDLSQPVTATSGADVRQRIVERVLEMAARAGVDDVRVLAATGLRRRLTSHELLSTLGERVFRSFDAASLTSHDAEDRDGMTSIGELPDGSPIEVASRLVESDVVVAVRLATAVGDEGSASLVPSFASAATARALTPVPGTDRVTAQQRDDALAPFVDRLGDRARVVTIAATLADAPIQRVSAFLGKREREWTLLDRVRSRIVRSTAAVLPEAVRPVRFPGIGHVVTSVRAGAPSAVHASTDAFLRTTRLANPPARADIALFGLPDTGYGTSGAPLDPISVATLGLGQVFDGVAGEPVVREGGVVILSHPLTPSFHPIHHAAYVDFFSDVLRDSTDAAVIAERFEDDFARDDWYRHLYRTSSAHHALHPFHAWYATSAAREHLSDVIVVGGDRETASQLGFRAATTLEDALDMAGHRDGGDTSLTFVHGTPVRPAALA
ncbi:lactate racemase domain-containing protein [Labedella endophytica]|uniref:DUF2088 domain-containing protein n=1 Tax=Labedella endophytica TaxID=1523160 RepID=A0A3S0X739_9MICO|nr:lactate racemase domain-containing protein [Labedella endophytica]RUR00863.1 DUF2088 domain-containing protein [Labedella endophytica]